MARAIALAALALSIALIAHGYALDTPASIVIAFFRGHHGHIDEERQLPVIERYVSARLLSRLRDAMAYRDDWSRDHASYPSELKPPWADGFDFTGNLEGVTRFSVVRTMANRDGSWNVDVNFSYGNVRWHNVIVVKRESGRYVIDDVLFEGTQRFSEILRERPF